MPDNLDRLHDLEKESEDWNRTKRPLHVFSTQCDGWRDQEDRQDEIDRIRNNSYPRRD